MSRWVHRPCSFPLKGASCSGSTDRLIWSSRLTVQTFSFFGEIVEFSDIAVKQSALSKIESSECDIASEKTSSHKMKLWSASASPEYIFGAGSKRIPFKFWYKTEETVYFWRIDAWFGRFLSRRCKLWDCAAGNSDDCGTRRENRWWLASCRTRCFKCTVLCAWLRHEVRLFFQVYVFQSSGLVIQSNLSFSVLPNALNYQKNWMYRLGFRGFVHWVWRRFHPHSIWLHILHDSPIIALLADALLKWWKLFWNHISWYGWWPKILTSELWVRD